MHNGQSTRAVTTQCHKRTRTDVNFTQEHSIGELKATSHQGGAPHVALSIASLREPFICYFMAAAARDLALERRWRDRMCCECADGESGLIINTHAACETRAAPSTMHVGLATQALNKVGTESD